MTDPFCDAIRRFREDYEKMAQAAADRSFAGVLFEKRTEKYGVIRVQEWPEGLVIWVGGEIRYRSWK